jgi:hypothetical protein
LNPIEELQPSTPRRRLAAGFLLLAVCLAGTWTAFEPTLRSRLALLQEDCFDPMVAHYALEHTYRVVTDRSYRFPLWSPPFFYPQRGVLAYSENMLGTFPFYFVLRQVLLPGASFQTWMIAMAAFTFFSFALTLRALGVSAPLSALGAFVFAYGIPRVAQLNHPQLLPQLFSPPAILTLWRFVRGPSLARLGFLLLLFYLQTLAGVYLGWFLVFGCAAFLGGSLILDPDSRARLSRFARAHPILILAALSAWSAVMYLTFRPYLGALREVGPRDWWEVAGILPRAWSWVAVPAGTIYSRWLQPPAGALLPWEQNLFAGFVIWILGGLSLLSLRRREQMPPETRLLVRISWLTFLLLFVLSLAIPLPGGNPPFSFWHAVFAAVPGGRAIRAITRIWTVAYLVLFPGLLLGAGVWIKNHFRASAVRRVILGVVLLAGIREHHFSDLPSCDKDKFFARARNGANLIRSRCSIAYFELSPPEPFYASQLAAMWAGLEAGVPVVNGYSGGSPPGYPSWKRTATSEELRSWISSPHRDLCVVSSDLASIRRLSW